MTEASKNFILRASIIITTLIGVLTWVYVAGLREINIEKAGNGSPITEGQIEENFTAVELPVEWGDLGAQMIAAGVIDQAKFEELYVKRGGLTSYEKQLLSGSGGKIMATPKNSGFILNLFWALGLSNKNRILDAGPMTDMRYGGAGRFASTAGWTIGRGRAMDHYSGHSFMMLKPEQQQLVERVSRGLYRPCCDNSTYLPDCNHGMAMLGLIELLASQGLGEDQIYAAALQMNTLWFPDQYSAITDYLTSNGRAISSIDPKEILGKEYSSISGFNRIASSMPREHQSGSNCSLSGENQKTGGCGI